jgi:hypothetical protein
MHIPTSNTSMIAGKKATIVVHLASVLFAQLSYSCSSSALLQIKSDFNLTTGCFRDATSAATSRPRVLEGAPAIVNCMGAGPVGAHLVDSTMRLSI